MVVRTQITLDADAHRRAKHRAADLGVSLAEYVRRTLDRDLGEEPKGDISEIFGLFDSGHSDVSGLGVTVAAGFDAHFSIYRIGPRRERAFEVCVEHMASRAARRYRGRWDGRVRREPGAVRPRVGNWPPEPAAGPYPSASSTA
jgi:hypothetical protein